MLDLMKYKQVGEKVLIRIDKNEEIIQTIHHICNQLQIKAGTITGIGATNKCTLGLFHTKTKQYESKEFIGDYEITSLLGNISTMKNDVYIHIHVTLCNSDQNAIGGHLSSAIISATFEGVIEVINDELPRSFHEKTGLNLLELK